MNEIVGQDKLLSNLRNYIKNEKMVHAYIFYGEEGIGKTTLAKEFAAMILCKEKDVNKRPCGKCSSCIKFNSGNHPDMYILEPEKKEYTIDQLSEIQKNMRIKPNESERKVFIFTEGDSLSVSFQNKFLKILEEPPESVVILITVNNIESLLDTTVSRCQSIKVNPVTLDDSIKYMASKYGDIADHRFIISFANGNIGKVQRLAEDQEFISLRDKVIDMTETIADKDLLKTMDKSAFFEEEKDNIYDILDILELWFRDILLYLKIEKKDYIINSDKYDIIKREANKFNADKIYEILDVIDSTKSDLKRNSNYTSSINRMLIEMN